MRVQALHAALRAADAAVRTRARVVGGKRRIALGRVLVVRGAQARSGRPRPRPRAPRRSTRSARHASTSAGSTSQKRVGIGVPSSRSGALRITIGVAGRVAHDDLERAARRAAEQHGEGLDVGVGRRHRPAASATGTGCVLGGSVVVVGVASREHGVGLLAREHHVELLAGEALDLARRLQALRLALELARSGASSTCDGVRAPRRPGAAARGTSASGTRTGT